MIKITYHRFCILYQESINNNNNTFFFDIQTRCVLKVTVRWQSFPRGSAPLTAFKLALALMGNKLKLGPNLSTETSSVKCFYVVLIFC